MANRSILPAPADGADRHELNSQQRRSASPRERQPKTRLACSCCRAAKAKCDGAHPVCARCSARHLACEYPLANPRPQELQTRADSLQRENDQLYEILGLLQQQDDAGSRDILERLHRSRDPDRVLRFIRKGADLRLQVHVNSIYDEFLGSRMKAVDQVALQASSVKLNSLPWTRVATRGIVSYLIHSFFVWDAPQFLQFIEKDSFLYEFELGDVKSAKFCSPLLVNAICAFRSFSAPHSKEASLILNDELHRRFIYEAKLMYDNERGKASIPTAQALMIMSMYLSADAQNSVGSLHRMTACAMLQRLNLDQKYQALKRARTKGTANTVLELRAISRAAWGCFTHESLSAFLNLEQSLVPIPRLPRDFDDLAFEATCDACLLLYEIMGYNKALDVQVDSYTDVRKRVEYLERIELLERSCKTRGIITPSSEMRLSDPISWIDMAVLATLRPLNRETRLTGNITAGQVCVARCANGVSRYQRHAQAYGFVDYSVWTLSPLLHTITTIVAHLHEPEGRHAFIRACELYSKHAKDFRFIYYFHVGISSMIEQMQVTLPEPLIPVMELAKSKVTDDLWQNSIFLPIPVHSEILATLQTATDYEKEALYFNLDGLIARWQRSGRSTERPTRQQVPSISESNSASTSQCLS